MLSHFARSSAQTYVYALLHRRVRRFVPSATRSSSRAPGCAGLARTTEEITKAVEGHTGFGSIQSAQFDRQGRQVFALWYCPFSGRAACYLHAYYFDYEKRWIRFMDRLVEGTSDLSAEMPTRDEVVISETRMKRLWSKSRWRSIRIEGEPHG